MSGTRFFPHRKVIRLLCHRLTAMALLLVACHTAQAVLPVSGPAVPELAGVDDVMQTWLQQKQFQAATLAVLKDGRLVYTRGYGWGNQALTQTIKSDAVMRLASNSKPVTAAAVRKLVSDGLLSLTTKVYDYLNVPPTGTMSDLRHLNYTVDDLLNHTSGIAGNAPGTGDLGRLLSIGRAATLRDTTAYMWTQALAFTPGTSNYSNWGYQLLGAVIEKASGMSYDQYVRTAIMNPLRAFTFKVGNSEGNAPNEIWYHSDSTLRPEADFNSTLPVVPAAQAIDMLARPAAGSLICSAPDYCRFLKNYYHTGTPKGSLQGIGWFYEFYGSLPGTWTITNESISSATGQIVYVILMNKRLETDADAIATLSTNVRTYLQAVPVWPAHDFFSLISGNGLPISLGSASPSLANYTHFGNALKVDGAVTRTYTIKNVSSSPLHLTDTPAVRISGAHASDFTLVSSPTTTLAPDGGSTTFSIRFVPSDVGTRTATVTVANDGSDQTPFVFAIQGTGIPPTLTAGPTRRTIFGIGGGQDFNITATGDWSWTMTGGAGWVTTSEPVNQNGDQAFSYNVSANPGATARTATITFVSGSLTATHVVFQQPGRRATGTVTAWGNNSNGQTTIPAGLQGVVAIASGLFHNLALKSDGTVVAWGSNSSGQTNVPADLGGVVAIAAGDYHSAAVKSDGTVVAWGSSGYSVTTVPAGLTNVISLVGGNYNIVSLKNDGTVVGWGRNDSQQASGTGLTDIVSLAAGSLHTLALKQDGTVVAFGNSGNGRTTVPAGLGAALGVAAGSAHSVAIKNDGTVQAWGDNTAGQTNVPVGLGGVIAISSRTSHTLALKNNGTVVAWGSNSYGQTTVPVGLNGIIGVAAGQNHSLVLKADSGTPVIAVFDGLAATMDVVRADNVGLYPCGAVEIGHGSVSQPFTIRNFGTAALTLSSVTSSNSAEFAVNTSGMAAVLAPDQTTSFNAVFTPSARGARSSVIQVLSNDTDQPLFRIQIGGTGWAGLQSWRQTHFGTTANIGIAADDQDFDRDTIPNLMEWAMGLNPTTSSMLPASLLLTNGMLGYTYVRSVDAVNAGSVFEVQWNDTLAPAGWSNAGVTLQILSDNGTLQQVKATIPSGGQPRRFVRLQITAPAP